MLRSLLSMVMLEVVIGCSPTAQRDLDEFESSGRIRGSFRLDGQLLQQGWVEMIELTGHPNDRCGPGDCGLTVNALQAGAFWSPGVWRLVPPRVEGWKTPAPIEVMVEVGRVTTFDIDYQRS